MEHDQGAGRALVSRREPGSSTNSGQGGGDWGCDSETGKLRAVLLRRPGKEIDRVDGGNYTQFRWKAPMDQARARDQQDRLAQVYRGHGAKVFYVENQREDRPNAMYMRDLVLMTPEGAIVGRPGIAARRGEERYAAEQLARLGVPIVATVHGDGFFDCACAMWVDRTTVIIGTGARANREGAAQVEAALRGMGVTTILPFLIPYGHAHLDGLINFADRRTALVFPWQVPYDLVKVLLDRDYKVVEATDLLEIKVHSAINFVALEPRARRDGRGRARHPRQAGARRRQGDRDGTGRDPEGLGRRPTA